MAQVYETYLDAVLGRDYDPRGGTRAEAGLPPTPRNRGRVATGRLDRPLGCLAKRGIDIAGGIALLILLGPFMALLALAVRRDGGPAFYATTRVGRGARPFACYRFRTMVVGAETLIKRILAADPEARRQWETNVELRNDPRVTAIGAVLCRTGLDALPQLINVLRGEMSLIGPRPLRENEIPAYGVGFACYVTVRPGLTGLWRVGGRVGARFASQAALDAAYIRHWTPWADARILLRTVFVVLARSRIY